MSSWPCRYRSQPRMRTWVLGLSLIAWAGLATAGESRIELRDGTVLRGEVVSAGGGAYRILSPSLGEIQVREADVAAIRPLGEGGQSTGAGADAGEQDHRGEMARIQQQLVGDPDILQAIMSLQNDPEIRAALADPAFAQLILSGNVDALSADPRFQRLMEHPGIKGILGRVQGPRSLSP